MLGKDRQSRGDSLPGTLPPHSHMAAMPSLTLVATVALVLAFAVTAVSQRDTQQRGFGSSFAAADLIALRQKCGAADPLEESFQLIRQHACSRSYSGAGQILAFEENRLFIYALADMSRERDSEDAGGS